MKRASKCKAAFFLIALLTVVFSSLSVAETISSIRAIEDAEYLWENLEAVHPNLYFEKTKDETESDFQKVIESLEAEKSWSELELYRLLAPFVASFKDGHTLLSIHHEFLHYADSGGNLFPLIVKVDRNELIVVENLSGKNPSPGKEILSINGQDAVEICRNIISLIGARSESFIHAKASDNFQIYLWALYGFSGPYEVSYQTESGERKIKKLTGISLSEYREGKDVNTERNELHWDLSFPRSDVGLLTINTFAGNLEEEFKEFVEGSFRELKERRTKNLIIDLRKNGGGSTRLSNYLYRFVSDKPFRTFAEVRVKYSDPVLKKNTLYNPITLFKVKALGEKIVVYKNDYKKPPGTKYSFDGELFIVTGPKTFSTAANFASVIKDVEAGKIVGEETGGLASSYGDIFKLSLPNSGLTLGVSYKNFLGPSGLDKGQGVIPDIPIQIRDYQGEDIILAEFLRSYD